MTDAKLFEQIETALASDKVVYLIHPHCPDAEKRLKTQDAVGLIRNSTLISKRRIGEAVFFRPTKDQFVPALQRYASSNAKFVADPVETSTTYSSTRYGKRFVTPTVCCALDAWRRD
jgi:hypothetical protein